MKSFLKNKISFNLLSVSSLFFTVEFLTIFIGFAAREPFLFDEGNFGLFIEVFILTGGFELMAIPVKIYIASLILSVVILIAEILFGRKIKNKSSVINVFYGILFYTGLSLSVVIILFLLHLAFVVYF